MLVVVLFSFLGGSLGLSSAIESGALMDIGCSGGVVERIGSVLEDYSTFQLSGVSAKAAAPEDSTAPRGVCPCCSPHSVPKPR